MMSSTPSPLFDETLGVYHPVLDPIPDEEPEDVPTDYDVWKSTFEVNNYQVQNTSTFSSNGAVLSKTTFLSANKSEPKLYLEQWLVDPTRRTG